MNDIDTAKLKKIPEWIKELDDGTYEITIKNEKYIMKELDGNELERCQRLAKNTNVDDETLLAARSLIQPKMTDEEFGKLKGGVYTRLKLATVYVYGLNDFF